MTVRSLNRAGQHNGVSGYRLLEDIAGEEVDIKGSREADMK
jgi:hypothetical protein